MSIDTSRNFLFSRQDYFPILSLKIENKFAKTKETIKFVVGDPSFSTLEYFAI